VLFGTVQKRTGIDYSALFNTQITVDNDIIDTAVEGVGLNQPITFTMLEVPEANYIFGGSIYFDIPNFFIAIGLESATATNRVSANPILESNTTP
jgi:hypothetical protein